MNETAIEPRTAIWAVAEVRWEDAAGTPLVAPATLEDTSPSGACLRVKTPVTVGSRLTIKWHREQFSAIARNCRSDGREYLLGVRREAVPSGALKEAAAKTEMEEATLESRLEAKVKDQKSLINNSPSAHSKSYPEPPNSEDPRMKPAASVRAGGRERFSARARPVLRDEASAGERSRVETPATQTRPPQGARRSPSQTQGIPSIAERKVMERKGLFSRFWGRPKEAAEAPEQATKMEVPVNKSSTQATEGPSGPQGNLLSYEDIYRAAGIMNSSSGYGVNKVVEMLDSARIRDLGKDVKRASVLMALDAAGTLVDDLLQDATRRQRALDSYEEGQRKQLEEYEARKTRENAEIQAEMDRLTAHYAERIQKNQEQVAKEKEALRNWQMVKQNEGQRIAEVIELCQKQPAGAATSAAAGASGGAGNSAGRPGLGGTSGGGKSN